MARCVAITVPSVSTPKNPIVVVELAGEYAGYDCPVMSSIFRIDRFCASPQRCTINPPWKSGAAKSSQFNPAVHAVSPSLVIACTV
jgi:hypothetical protein